MMMTAPKTTGVPVVRQLQLTDHAEWLRLRHALWPNCSDDMHVLEMRKFLDHPEQTEVFVYETEPGKLGGFVEVCVRDRVDGSYSRRVGYVEGWYVEPDQRHQMIGRHLLKAAEKWVARQGITEIASDCDIDDESALRVHLATGFRETFRLVHFLKRIERNGRG